MLFNTVFNALHYGPFQNGFPKLQHILVLFLHHIAAEASLIAVLQNEKLKSVRNTSKTLKMCDFKN